MSRLVNLSDPVYEELTRLKKAKGASYSEVIAELLPGARKQAAKTDNWDNLIAWLKENDRHFKGKKVKIDHDLIAHGVSRDSS